MTQADDLRLRVCLGPECGQVGAAELLEQLQALGANVERMPCQGLCHEAPVVKQGGRCLSAQDFDALLKRLIAHATPSRLPSRAPNLSAKEPT